MKHIAIDYHFVHDHVARGSFSVAHISSKDQLADTLTKPLPCASFQALRSKIGNSSGSNVLRGPIEESDSTSTESEQIQCPRQQDQVLIYLHGYNN